MDHPCEKCGAAVEDGRPFCAHCRAPQIHVQVAVAAEMAGNPGISDPTLSIPHAADFGGMAAPHAVTFDRGIATRSALKAGILGLFIGIIPILGVALTGALAVYFYRRESGRAPAAAVGSRLGGAAGVVTFAINSLLMAIRVLVFHAQQEYIDWILKIAQRVGYNTADPEIQATVHNLFTPAGLVLMLLFGMIFTVVLAAVGGAIGTMFLRHPPRN